MPDTNLNRPIQRSRELYERALKLIPGGTQLVSRRPMIFAPGVAPIFAERGSGSRLYDVDGGEYLDYGMSVSACILGYADPAVDEAVRSQIGRGTMYSLNHPAELDLAECLCETIPCAEMVRFAKGGGEACAVAVRIARGVSGRDKLLFCGYHGWHDWYLAANLETDQTLDEHLLPGIEPIGVPRALAGTAIAFPYGDAEALAALLRQHGSEVAAVIMEPLRSDPPPAGYLQQVRDLTRRHDVVLIFDEVTSGFRHAVGGAEEFTDVVPDMAVLAKSLANGYAMGAVVGRREVMEPASRMFISSTNWSDLVGIQAAIATLNEIGRRDVPQKLADYGRRLIDGFNAIAGDLGLAARMSGLPATPRMEFSATERTADSRLLQALYNQEMARRGVLINVHPRHSAAHTDEDLEVTLAATREALAALSDADRVGKVRERLVEVPQPPVFRRLVQ